jgi:hypothetical protein
LGTVSDPFSAHRYIRFQGELSHATLAQGDTSWRVGFQVTPRMRTYRPRKCRFGTSQEGAGVWPACTAMS